MHSTLKHINTVRTLRACAAAVTLSATGAAWAHPGHASGTESLVSGLAHPFLGLDHLLAMVAVGLWSAAALPAGRRWIGPAVFLALLLAGALMALGGLHLPLVEPGVALSVLIFGVLMLGGRRIPLGLGLPLIALGALLHGAAHGNELVAGHAFSGYAAGFMLASALLHGIGLAAGRGLLALPAWAWRATSALLALGGLVLLAGRL